MLPPDDKLTICFAHVAYQLHERFSTLDAGINSFAVRDPETHPDLIRNICRKNMLSGILLFHHAEALVLDNSCYDNQHWGLVTTPECQTSPQRDQLAASNRLESNPRGALMVTHEPLGEIGR